MPDKITGLGPLRETREAETDAYFQHMERIAQRQEILSHAIREMRRFSTRAEIVKTLRDAIDVLEGRRR
jgi:hypothetical protein